MLQKNDWEEFQQVEKTISDERLRSFLVIEGEKINTYPSLWRNDWWVYLLPIGEEGNKEKASQCFIIWFFQPVEWLCFINRKRVHGKLPINNKKSQGGNRPDQIVQLRKQGLNKNWRRNQSRRPWWTFCEKKLRRGINGKWLRMMKGLIEILFL